MAVTELARVAIPQVAVLILRCSVLINERLLNETHTCVQGKALLVLTWFVAKTRLLRGEIEKGLGIWACTKQHKLLTLRNIVA